ncbi:hypothetical protein [Streptomyces rhizosphaericus]|uniref:hypothetical protein n=1 Tax=Streptomyces rhizosphaericus TaxID=114699 RepID=UPI00363E2279
MRRRRQGPSDGLAAEHPADPAEHPVQGVADTVHQSAHHTLAVVAALTGVCDGWLGCCDGVVGSALGVVPLGAEGDEGTWSFRCAGAVGAMVGAALEGAASGVAGAACRGVPALRSEPPPPEVASVWSEISFGFEDSLGETWLCEGE